jgi:hypothetical protein
MFVYFQETTFGQQIVSQIKRTPFGVSIIYDNSKPMHYEEVNKLLTVSEKQSHNLVLGFVD